MIGELYSAVVGIIGFLRYGGRLAVYREVCGAFSACTMLAGLANKSDLEDAAQAKAEAYKEIRFLKE